MRSLFSRRETRALALLVPVLAVSAWLVVSLLHPHTDDTERLYVSALSRGEVTDSGATNTDAGHSADNGMQEETSLADSLFVFDPNTVSYEELRLLGVEKRTAASIIKYRTAGKVFRIREDLATCYGMTDSLYAVLKPYIRIGEEHALKPSYKDAESASVKPSAGDTTAAEVRPTPEPFPFNPNTADHSTFVSLGFSERQAQTIINYREACGGFRNAEHFGKCRAVPAEMLERLRPYMVWSTSVAESSDSSVPKTYGKTELNGADSATLVSLNGIGAWSASEILKYRARLGGFYSAEQLLDLKAVTEENYRKICEQIWIDTCKIQKIYINFATPESMSNHPYMTGSRLRRILITRQLKGGWDTVEDMIVDHTLTAEEAARLAPYLQFVRIEP